MPKVIVKYKNKRTPEVLQDFSKYFGFEILLPDLPGKNKKQLNFNGVTIIPADSSVDTTELTEIFSGKNLNALELRNEAWQKRKLN